MTPEDPLGQHIESPDPIFRARAIARSGTAGAHLAARADLLERFWSAVDGEIDRASRTGMVVAGAVMPPGAIEHFAAGDAVGFEIVGFVYTLGPERRN